MLPCYVVHLRGLRKQLQSILLGPKVLGDTSSVKNMKVTEYEFVKQQRTTVLEGTLFKEYNEQDWKAYARNQNSDNVSIGTRRTPLVTKEER